MGNEAVVSILTTPLLETLLAAVGAVLMALGPSLVLAVLVGEVLRGRARRAGLRVLEAIAPLPLFLWLSAMTGVPAVGNHQLLSIDILVPASLLLVPRLTPGLAGSLLAVPKAIRRAGAALGAGRIAITRELIIPAARKGIRSVVLSCLASSLLELSLLPLLTQSAEPIKQALPVLTLSLVPAVLAKRNRSFRQGGPV